MWWFGFLGFCLVGGGGESSEVHLSISKNLFPGFVVTGVYIASSRW